APKLEGERAELGVVVREDFDLLAIVRILTDSRFNLNRAGKIIDNRVHEILDAFVLKCRSADDGNKIVGDGLASNTSLEHLRRDRLFLEKYHRDLFVEVADLFDEIGVSFVGLSHLFGSKLLDRIG